MNEYELKQFSLRTSGVNANTVLFGALNGQGVPAGTPPDVVSVDALSYRLLLPTVRPEKYGGFSDGNSDASAAISLALADLKAAGGGRLLLTGPGIYKLTNQGAASMISPGGGAAHRYSILIDSSYIEVEIGPAAIAMLAANTQTDASGPIDLIVVNAGLRNVCIHGGGTISGNSENQPGWTGATQPAFYNGAYAQDINGCGINTGSGGLIDNLVIENLNLENTFANPVNIGGNSGTPNTHILLRNLRGSNHGEGFQLAWCDDVLCENITFEDLTTHNKATGGDGFELAFCNRAVAKNIKIRATNPNLPQSSGMDLGGCTDLLVDGFVIDGWWNGIGPNTGLPTAITDRALVCNGIIRNLIGNEVMGQNNFGRLKYSNISVFDCPNAYMMQITPDATFDQPPIEMYNVSGDRCAPVLYGGETPIIWHGGGIKNATQETYGVFIQRDPNPATASHAATISIANPAVLTWTTHGLTAGTRLTLTTSGALPTGLVIGKTYWVRSAGLTANTFQVSAIPGGPAIVTTGSQSGTHTVHIGNNSNKTIDFSDLIFNNPSYDMVLNNIGYGPIAMNGRIFNTQFVGANSPGSVTCAANDTWTGVTAEAVFPSEVYSNATGITDWLFKTLMTRDGGDINTVLAPTIGRVITIGANGAFVVKDARQAGGANLYLSGGVNYSMVQYDTLTLKYNSAMSAWIETARSHNS